jgi:hypothetical protein
MIIGTIIFVIFVSGVFVGAIMQSSYMRKLPNWTAQPERKLMEELKSCPFCGSDPSITGKCVFRCGNEDCTLSDIDIEMTLEQWQTRPSPSKQALDEEAVVKAMVRTHTLDGIGLTVHDRDRIRVYAKAICQHFSGTRGLSEQFLYDLALEKLGRLDGKVTAFVKAIHAAQPSDRTVGELVEGLKTITERLKLVLHVSLCNRSDNPQMYEDLAKAQALISKHTTGKE